MSRLRGQIPEGLSVMTRSRVVRKSLNPLLWQTWVFGWYLIRAFRYKLADRVNAYSGWFARWIRWPLGVGSPDRWSEVHVVRIGGIGDSLMSTPALRLLKQVRPQIRIDFYSPYVEAFRGLPFLDEVRPLEDYPHPSAVWFLTKPRAVKYSNITDGYRARVETGAGRGRPGAASALCGPERDAPPRPLLGCRRRGRHPRRAGLRAGARRRRG